jgi:hypothetical protein
MVKPQPTGCQASKLTPRLNIFWYNIATEALDAQLWVSWDEDNSFELLVTSPFSSLSWFVFCPAVNASGSRTHAAGKPSRSNSTGFAIITCPVIASPDNVA